MFPSSKNVYRKALVLLRTAVAFRILPVSANKEPSVLRLPRASVLDAVPKNSKVSIFFEHERTFGIVSTKCL